VKFDGTGLASGVYFCVLQADGVVKTLKAIMMK